jgi:death-on-curing protein
VTDAGPAFAFLTVEDALSLHEDAINTWGGTHGIRDRGLLESAVGAATNVALYDQAADIYDIAAAYAYHLAQNQPFLDGNKRAGLAAAAAFLFMNGIDLLDRDDDVESVLAKAMIDVAEKRWPEPRRALASVLRRLSRARWTLDPPFPLLSRVRRPRGGSSRRRRLRSPARAWAAGRWPAHVAVTWVESNMDEGVL